ncbi:unnamed protein product, partial [Pleuronectes platessa]
MVQSDDTFGESARLTMRGALRYADDLSAPPIQSQQGLAPAPPRNLQQYQGPLLEMQIIRDHLLVLDTWGGASHPDPQSSAKTPGQRRTRGLLKGPWTGLCLASALFTRAFPGDGCFVGETVGMSLANVSVINVTLSQQVCLDGGPCRTEGVTNPTLGSRAQNFTHTPAFRGRQREVQETRPWLTHSISGVSAQTNGGSDAAPCLSMQPVRLNGAFRKEKRKKEKKKKKEKKEEKKL